MSQVMTLDPASTSLHGEAAPACPGWCAAGPHADGSPHFGGLIDMDLSLAEQLGVPTADGVSTVTDWLTAGLWQDVDGDTPVIGLVHQDTPLPDMTLAEAEALAGALLDLVRSGRAAA